MTAPLEIVLQRHGFTEANAAQRADRLGIELPNEQAIWDRHDSQQRLASHTLDEALAAAGWCHRNGLDPATFDERFVSTHIRGLESALEFAPQCEWLPSLALVERDWGSAGAMRKAERDETFPHDAEQLRRSSFYGRHAGGQNIHDMVFQVRDIIDTWWREYGLARVWAMCHGETVSTAMCVIERWMPSEWEAFEDDPAMRLGNFNIVNYTRQCPTDPTIVVPSMSSGWRRIIDPVYPERSPLGGEWVRLRGKQRLNARQLSELVDASPRLLPDCLPTEILPATKARSDVADLPDQDTLPG